MPKPNASPSLKWTGTKGDDIKTITAREALGNASYDAGAGYDTLDLSGLTEGISLTVNLNKPGTSRLWLDSPFHGSWWDYDVTGSVIENTIKNFEKIIGTSGNDYIDFAGGTVARVVDGGGGDDAIMMGSSTGTNTAYGGTGSDQLFGSRPTDQLYGGTGNIGGDDTSDEFVMYEGTIRDFELGVDRLYVDANGLPSRTTNATWVDYSAGARLTLETGQVITVFGDGVTAAAMNATPTDYVFGVFSVNSNIVSGPGDDLISDTAYTNSVNSFIFANGSGKDYLVGFDLSYDTLVFESAPTFSEVEYHGDAALLATYDGGASSVLLIGLDQTDIGGLNIDPWG